MAVAPNGDLGCRPVRADTADDPAQMAAHFLAGRRFARTQNDCDRTPGGGVVNMDRKEAALVIMRIEQRQLLMTMRDIAGIIDIERDGLRRRGVTGAIKIDEDAAQFHYFAQGRRVLPTRHGGLRTQVGSRIGQSPAGKLEGWILAQMIEVVRILVAAGDGENASAKDTAQRMGDQQGIARISDDGGEFVRHSEPPFGLPQQHHARIRRDAPAVESGGNLLAANGWKREWEKDIFNHGGCGFDAMA